MASVVKPKGRKVWRIKFKDQHGQQRVGVGYRDKQASRELAAKVEKDAQRLAAGLQPEHPDLSGPYLGLPVTARGVAYLDCVRQYLSDLERRRCRPETIKGAKKKLHRLGQLAGWKTLADITPQSLTAVLTQFTCANTINAYRDAINAMMQWAIDQGWLSDNPVRRVRRSEASRDRPHRRRAFTGPELLRLTPAVSQRWADYYAVLSLTGLRQNELSLIERRDIDLEGKTWVCRPEVDKEGKHWRLPIMPELLATLTRLCAGQEPQAKLFPKKPHNETFDLHLKKAGLVKIGTDGRRLNGHSLRYTFCTMLARHLPIQTVQRLMRHSDIRRTVNLYLDLGLQDIAQAVEAMPNLLPPAETAKNDKGEDAA